MSRSGLHADYGRESYPLLLIGRGAPIFVRKRSRAAVLQYLDHVVRRRLVVGKRVQADNKPAVRGQGGVAGAIIHARHHLKFRGAAHGRVARVVCHSILLSWPAQRPAGVITLSTDKDNAIGLSLIHPSWRTSENSVKANFAEFLFHALG